VDRLGRCRFGVGALFLGDRAIPFLHGLCLGRQGPIPRSSGCVLRFQSTIALLGGRALGGRGPIALAQSTLLRTSREPCFPSAGDDSRDKYNKNYRHAPNQSLVATREFLYLVDDARRPGRDRFVV